MKGVGKVYLVGAGPGDPGLLTIKGRDLIEDADCVIYDYLVSPEILAFASPDAEMIYVGKRGSEASWAQGEINALLLEKAREHELIVRLKGGDPFIFGRGAEEAEALVKAGVEWEVVPGVTAGASVAAYAGIPITHREISSSVAFVTGQESPSKSESAIRWDKLATGVDTLVFFMGVSRINEIADRLTENGRAAHTPVAVIRWGTRENQKTWISDLSNVADVVKREKVSSPALIVVGEVVRLREQLQWFTEQHERRFADYATPNPFFEAIAS